MNVADLANAVLFGGFRKNPFKLYAFQGKIFYYAYKKWLIIAINVKCIAVKVAQ